MKRRRAVALVAVAVGIAATLSRCDPRQPGAAAKVEAQRTIGDVVRRDLRFPCGSAECAGWLYLPADSARPPVVVMAHGFAGTRDVGLPAMAEHLAKEGIAAFVFDYRYFGASGGSPRQIVDPPSQLDDWRAALRFVRAQPALDGDRVALFGSSLGAGHALIIAAEDARLRAVVGQAPLIDTGMEGEASAGGVAATARLLFSAWADFALSAVGGDPLLLPAIAPSGSFGMIADDAAHTAFEKLVAPTSTYRNAVAARSIFLFDDYNPAAHLDAVRAPVLLIASRGDRFAPFAAVRAAADRGANVEVATFDGDHFDVYSPPAAEQAQAAAADFLRRHFE